jgi:hypothetical protein
MPARVPDLRACGWGVGAGSRHEPADSRASFRRAVSRALLRCAPVAVAAGALIAPGAAHASRGMLVGAAEDAAKAPTLAEAKTKMDLAKLAGLDAIRLTEQWQRGETAPQAADLQSLQNAVDAADLDGIVVYVSVYPSGSSQTPRTAQQRARFARFAGSLATALPTVQRFIVGNEPNLNRFWLPQFDKGGRDVGAPAYEDMLARSYDAIKAASPTATVIGGALSPRGNDSIVSRKHSPTTFLRDLGRAYRASGRRRPIMDAFSLHPYEDNSSIAPSFRHPHSTTISIADYGKLVHLLAVAFHGTAQPGARMPIVYDEFGVQSRIPAAKQAEYEGFKPASERPVTETTQARYYVEALALAACEPTVETFLIFHVSDEPDLDRWQSGLYYADDTPKTSLPVVRSAIDALHSTGIGGCSAAAVSAFALRAFRSG